VGVVMDENSRTAAGMAMTLSIQLMTVGFTMLTILAAFVTFFFDKRQPGVAFLVAAIVAFLAFIIGALVGGRGIAALYRDVASGTWDPSKSKSVFNVQAIVTSVGMLAFAVSLMLSGSSGHKENLWLAVQRSGSVLCGVLATDPQGHIAMKGKNGSTAVLKAVKTLTPTGLCP